jgi:predicted DNA-binding protein (MmcQ/YjbR family)
MHLAIAVTVAVVNDHERARAELCRVAASYPEAYEDHPWGETVYKVRGKVFVFFGLPAPGMVALTVKLPGSQPFALAEPFASAAGYGLGQAGWVTVRFEPGTDVPVDLLALWIDESYRAVAPRVLVRQLGDAHADP